MADTTLDNLYEQAGSIDAIEQSLLRHIISRKDQLKRWEFDQAYADDHPNDAEAQARASVKKPDVPPNATEILASLGWEIIEQRNLRGEADPDNFGKPKGSYGYALLRNTLRPDLANKLFRVNAPTDSEGNDSPTGVVQGHDGTANLAMNEGTKVDPYIVQYANSTREIYENAAYNGLDLVDLNESMSGTTVQVGHGISLAHNRNFSAYTYNGYVMNGFLAQKINLASHDQSSALNQALGEKGMEEIPYELNGDGAGPVVLGGSNQHYLVNNDDAVGNFVSPPQGSIVVPVRRTTFLRELENCGMIVSSERRQYGQRSEVLDTNYYRSAQAS
jgi:hypothetical protein